jgi:hypothetical protein
MFYFKQPVSRNKQGVFGDKFPLGGGYFYDFFKLFVFTNLGWLSPENERLSVTGLDQCEFGAESWALDVSTLLRRRGFDRPERRREADFLVTRRRQ